MGGIRREEALMPAFYLEGPAEVGATVALPKEEARHALRVLRMSVGDGLCALDGRGGRFAAVLESVRGDEAMVRLTEALPSNEPPVRVTLYQGLPKADKLDFIVQKLTELGAACVVPVKMERCVVKSDAKDGAKRRERLEKIAREAAKQCRRACAPEIAEPLTWKQCFARMESHDLLLVPWEDAQDCTLKGICAGTPRARDIGIVVGPEGGMSTGEVEALKARGARIVTLGPRILRTETAAVASVAMAMTLWGDL